MKRRVVQIVGGLAALLLLVYIADFAWLQVRASRNQSSAYDSVQVEVVEQIPQKGNKAEYVPEDPRTQTCVRSIFPHTGDQPCWYLRRHAQQQINY
jgi:hypothetical protein